MKHLDKNIILINGKFIRGGRFNLELKNYLDIYQKKILIYIIKNWKKKSRWFIECFECPYICKHYNEKGCVIVIDEIDRNKIIELFNKLYGEEELFEELL